MKESLSPEAVQTVTDFGDYPILWLGEDFMGFKLTSAGDIFGGDLGIVYGSCERRSGETSCTPPLVIINQAPKSSNAGGTTPVRGITTSGNGVGSTTLWTKGGLGIEVQSNLSIRDEIIEALVIANADNFGLPEISPGESLAPLNEWSI